MHVAVDARLRAGDQMKCSRHGHAADADFAVARDPRQLRLRRRAQLGDAMQVERPATRRGDAAVERNGLEVGRRLGRRLARTAERSIAAASPSSADTVTKGASADRPRLWISLSDAFVTRLRR